MLKMKDKKAFIFYFLMSIIFWDFGNQLRNLSYNPDIENINNYLFSIIHIHNTGGAFSIFQNHTSSLAIFAIIVLGYIAYYVYSEITFKDKISLFSLTLFTGGTLGNLFERTQNGYVIDYIKLKFIDFPVFNAFDIMICVGIFLYIIFVLFEIKIPKINFKGNK